MTVATSPALERRPGPGGPRSRTRVAIAGATGYAGQELVRILARHPAVTLTAAMSSGAASAPRPLPALERIWDGTVTPLDVDQLAAEADVVFLALPEAASAELAPKLLERGVRVIDLSGAFRIRADEDRQRWYPATASLPDGTVYGMTEGHQDVYQARAPGVEPRLLSHGGAARARSARQGRPARRRRGGGCEVGPLGCRQDRRPIARTSRRTTAAWPPTASSRTGTWPRSSRSSACR